MKDINFVKTLSVKEQQNVRRWAYFSFGTIGITIIGIIALQIPQLTTLTEIKKEHQQLTHNINSINTRLAQNQNLKTKMCCLGDQCKTIDSLACATQTPRACINTITQACNTNIHLQACDLKNKHLALTAQCNNVQQATHFLNQLKTHAEFSQLKLVSLQPAPGNLVTFIIKGLTHQQNSNGTKA